MSGAALEQGGELRPAWRLVLERERRFTAAALLLVATAAWIYVLARAGMPDMGGMDPHMVMAPEPWPPSHAAAVFLMWWIMMAAMMLPSAAPAILLYDLVARRTQPAGGATLPFALGYLVVWGGFSLAAALLHWALDRSGLLTMGMAAGSGALGAAMLIGAGLWQLTPIKRACLVRCQNPIQFLAHRWRPGRLAALRMGVEHGIHCLGCCWVMMGLLFYGGVMNFAWIGGIALYILIEKTIPAAHWLSRAFGLGLLFAGAATLALTII
jgi:predicted metal-binding membrane protein